MDSAELQRRLRYAFSWREKAALIVKDCIRGRAADAAADIARLDDRVEDAQRNIDAAEKEIERLHRALVEQSARLAKQLASALNDKKALSESAETGRVSPRDADKAARRLDKRIDSVRATLARLNELNAAKTSAHLGGFVDVPLPDYAPACRGEPRAGAVRVRPTPLLRKINWTRVSLILLVMVAAVAAVVILRAWLTGVGVGAVRFDVSPAAENEHRIALSCMNTTKQNVYLHLVWAAYAKAGLDDNHFGVLVYVREQDSDKFRLVSDVGDCWSYEGRPLTGRDSLEIEPGIVVTVGFDVDGLAELDLAPGAVKFEITRPNGRLVYAEEVATTVP